MGEADNEVTGVILRALDIRDEDEPVEFAVLRACRELHPGKHLELFYKTMGTITDRAEKTDENWEESAISLAPMQDGKDSDKNHSLRDVPEPLRNNIWERLHRGRRGSRGSD